MKTLRVLVLIAAAGAGNGAVAQSASNGDWKMNMVAELADWHAAPLHLDLAHFRDDAPLGVRLDLTLRPNGELKFLVAPRRAPKPASFGGLLHLTVSQDGLYRVSAGSPVWLDVVDPGTGRSVPSPGFEMQMHSDLRKCVLFPLRAGVRYILQISGSSAPAASILITPDVS